MPDPRIQPTSILRINPDSGAPDAHGHTFDCKGLTALAERQAHRFHERGGGGDTSSMTVLTHRGNGGQ